MVKYTTFTRRQTDTRGQLRRLTARRSQTSLERRQERILRRANKSYWESKYGFPAAAEALND